MKIKTSFPHFLKMALSLVLIHAFSFSALAQGTVTISKPGHEAYYEYTNGAWEHIHNTTYTYDVAGQPVLQVSTTPVTNQNLEKTEFTETNATNPTGVTKTKTATTYAWQNNAWVTTRISADITVLNAANQTTEYIWQDLKNGALTNSRKKGYVYDAAGNLIEETEYLWTNNAWQNFYRNTYTYVQGTRTERLIHNYNTITATWVPGAKHIYSGWHVPNWQPIIETHQTKGPAGNWVDYNRYTYTVSANGGLVCLIENFTNNNWINSSRSTVIRDTQRNRTDQTLENYKNSAWGIIWHSKFLNTYSSQNDLEQLIVQEKDTVSGAFMNEQKFVYSNFQYFTRALGAPENQKTELALNIYPNPASDKIQIQLAESKSQILTISVKDIAGKNFLSKTYQAGEAKQLNIEALPKGVYLLQVQTETGSTVKRIVKQ